MRRSKKVIIFVSLVMFLVPVVLLGGKEKAGVEEGAKPEKLTIVVYEQAEARGLEKFGQIFTDNHGIEIEIFAIPWANLHEKIIADLTATI
jgi:ABC-type glycerol-3-phosphate transport system substrate-binding protein